MAYYTGQEIESDLIATVKQLNRLYNGGPYTYDFYLDPRSNLAEIFIENEGVEPADPEDLKDVMRANIGYILDIYDTELRMGEYSFQIIVQYNKLK